VATLLLQTLELLVLVVVVVLVVLVLVLVLVVLVFHQRPPTDVSPLSMACRFLLVL
jgi:hypothetical protein